MPNFFDKGKYVLHFENLQLYLRLGLKHKKNHRVLEFNQSQWLQSSVEFNIQKITEEEETMETKMEKLCTN